MKKIVLLRHGQSLWNEKGLFTGWRDPSLSEKGRKEATRAGRTLKKAGFEFDHAFVSPLRRVTQTLDLVLAAMKAKGIVIDKDKALNERNYGQLAGKNKQALVKKYGLKQVMLWRRSYEVAPPGGESLKDVEKRLIAYYKKEIVPAFKGGDNILIVASGNSLRALVKNLSKMNAKAVSELNIPTGIPLVYEFDDKLKPKGYKYLADEREVKKAVAKVKGQIK